VNNGESDRPVALVPAARLLGRLLVRELDDATLVELTEPAIAAALADLGIHLPAASALPQLAADYFDLFVRPASGLPPVQSLWREGQYDGQAAIAVRAIAAAAGRELAEGARGAPPDHLGCILLLWAELCDERPELAVRLAQDHMAWGERALQAAAALTGFHADVARVTVGLLREITGQPAASARPPQP
jgi:TorA maturation chaperone TorD